MEELKQSRAKVAGIEKANASATVTPVKNVKIATDRMTDLKVQVFEYEKPTNDALKWFIEIARRVELLEGAALMLKLYLNDMENARDVAVSGLEGRSEEVRALMRRMLMLYDELGSLNCRVSTNCDLEIVIRKAVDGHGSTSLVRGLHWRTGVL